MINCFAGLINKLQDGSVCREKRDGRSERGERLCASAPKDLLLKFCAAEKIPKTHYIEGVGMAILGTLTHGLMLTPTSRIEEG